MIGYLCKSLRIISLVWPTRLIFLAMGEVLSFGFNLAVLDPSDRKGNTTYCIVAIKDKKMGFMKEICPRGNNKVVIYISLYHDKCLLFMPELF